MGTHSREGGSTVIIAGGELGDDFSASSGSIVNITGGTLGDRFDFFGGSQLNLFVTQFLVDGKPIGGMSIGDHFTVSARGVTLSGLWAERGDFAFFLNTNFRNEDAY